ncbi:class I SAM-dependent methyltransferase [Lysobacter gummosus]|uniref:class I SAM-dependent methyltransferase n=1 Tax=Lysobacter gummosus TaxID=262324 RepID=UPI00362BCEED
MKSHRKPGTWTFFRQWLKNPLRVAAVAPSSAELAAAMIAELPDDVQRVIELGGGTGAITRALLDAGVRDEDLLVLELNEELHAHLHMRFPRVPVLLGDARLLPKLAREQGYLDAGKADAIVSGLGLLTMPHPCSATSSARRSNACARTGCSCSSPTARPRRSPMRSRVRCACRCDAAISCCATCRRRRCMSIPGCDAEFAESAALISPDACFPCPGPNAPRLGVRGRASQWLASRGRSPRLREREG